jgi:hypothetical protein
MKNGMEKKFGVWRVGKGDLYVNAGQQMRAMIDTEWAIAVV